MSAPLFANASLNNNYMISVWQKQTVYRIKTSGLIALLSIKYLMASLKAVNPTN